MTSREVFFIKKISALALVLLAPFIARADETRTLPTIESGAHFFSGVAESSLTGALAYPLQFRSEATRGTYRPAVAAEFIYSAGSTSVTSSTTTYTLYGGSFVPSYSVYAFREGYFQPFMSVGGIIGWHYLKLGTPPTGVEAYTQGFSYGYELSSGVDIRFGGVESSALRIKCSMSTIKSRIGGLTSFGLGGFRFMIGYVF